MVYFRYLVAPCPGSAFSTGSQILRMTAGICSPELPSNQLSFSSMTFQREPVERYMIFSPTRGRPSFSLSSLKL
jgi:hypothetical protein